MKITEARSGQNQQEDGEQDLPHAHYDNGCNIHGNADGLCLERKNCRQRANTQNSIIYPHSQSGFC